MASNSSGGTITFPRTVCRSDSQVLGMVHWQWRTIEVASGVMNSWPPKEERKREVLTFRGAKITSITQNSDPKQFQKLMKNAADAAAKRPANVSPIGSPAFVRLELPSEKGKVREVFIVVPDEELQAWLRVFTGAQDAQRFTLMEDGSKGGASATSAPNTPTKAATNPALIKTTSQTAPGGSVGSGGAAPSASPSAPHLMTAPGAMQPNQAQRASTQFASAPPFNTNPAGLTGGGGSSPNLVAQRNIANAMGTRPASMSNVPLPTASLGAGARSSMAPGTMRPMSTAAPALPPDPNVMLTLNDSASDWSIGTIADGASSASPRPASAPSLTLPASALTLDDPDDGPVIISTPGAGLTPVTAAAPVAAASGLPLDPNATFIAADAPPPNKSPWTEYFADDGVPYYHNEVTGDTTWERPAEMDGALMPSSPQPQVQPQVQPVPVAAAVPVAVQTTPTALPPMPAVALGPGQGPGQGQPGMMMRGGGVGIVPRGARGGPVIVRGGPMIVRGGQPGMRGQPMMMRGAPRGGQPGMVPRGQPVMRGQATMRGGQPGAMPAYPMVPGGAMAGGNGYGSGQPTSAPGGGYGGDSGAYGGDVAALDPDALADELAAIEFGGPSPRGVVSQAPPGGAAVYSPFGLRRSRSSIRFKTPTSSSNDIASPFALPLSVARRLARPHFLSFRLSSRRAYPQPFSLSSSASSPSPSCYVVINVWINMEYTVILIGADGAATAAQILRSTCGAKANVPFRLDMKQRTSN